MSGQDLVDHVLSVSEARERERERETFRELQRERLREYRETVSFDDLFWSQSNYLCYLLFY